MFKAAFFFALLAVAYAKPAYIAAPYSTWPITSYSAYPAVVSAAPALSLPPQYPAAIVGTDGRPLDTIEVNSAKALHYTAKALNYHGIAKRDVVAPWAYSAYSTPLVTAVPKPTVYSAPYVSTHYASGVVAPAFVHAI